MRAVRGRGKVSRLPFSAAKVAALALDETWDRLRRTSTVSADYKGGGKSQGSFRYKQISVTAKVR